MRRRFPANLLRMIVIALAFLGIAQAASAQSADRQALCQASWDRCLGTIDGGKNWKPLYDRCLKARATCLGGLAYAPPPPSLSSASGQSLDTGYGSDPANADPATRMALCTNGQTRGGRSSCRLAAASDGYGQTFSLLGPGVPMSRIQRASSVVKCAGGNEAMFYPNGRIESCTLDNYGAPATPLSDTSGKSVTCGARAMARFDPEGRLLSCN